jgi:hypothetical protein
LKGRGTIEGLVLPSKTEQAQESKAKSSSHLVASTDHGKQLLVTLVRPES